MLTGDPGDEHRRIDNAIDVDLPRRAERDAFCEMCGATPGSPCVSIGPGQQIKTAPHEMRLAAYKDGHHSSSHRATEMTPVATASEILQHREPWLRNEATLFHAPHADSVYKNPFGGVTDGMVEAEQTQAIGTALKTLLG